MATATVSVVGTAVVWWRVVGERAARRRRWLPPVVAWRSLVMMKWMLWPPLVVAVAMRPWWRLPWRWRSTRRRRRPGLPSAVSRSHGPHSGVSMRYMYAHLLRLVAASSARRCGPFRALRKKPGRRRVRLTHPYPLRLPNMHYYNTLNRNFFGPQPNQWQSTPIERSTDTLSSSLCT